MEFLKANGIEDHSFVKEMDYQEVLNSQEIFGDELAMFAKKELQKEVSRLFLHAMCRSLSSVVMSLSLLEKRFFAPPLIRVLMITMGVPVCYYCASNKGREIGC